jgi:23S rRNA (cytosine1962-C5)-methyltransferase
MNTVVENREKIAVLVLKKNEDRRLRAGHVWIFSNEIDTRKSPLSGFTAGEIVEIQAGNGRFLGYGYVNPHSLICARLLSRRHGCFPDTQWLRKRCETALSLRESVFPAGCYRMVYGESDQLPGLVVDRYGKTLVIQVTTAGMEIRLDEIVGVLDDMLDPEVIVLRNDSSIREMEGLESYTRVVKGGEPYLTSLEENGVLFGAPLGEGQKTGWFFDHRDNRARLARYVRNKRVLDLFSYIGGWGIQAVVAGASEAVCVDASKKALELVQHNADLNRAGEKVSVIQGDAFDVLKALREQGEQFDVIVLDPPAFIKRRKDHKKGIEAYQRLNELAMRLLPQEGILVSASCSFHLQADELKRVVLRAARQGGRNLSILEQGSQGPDHPVHPAIPETAYLKALFCRVYSD